MEKSTARTLRLGIFVIAGALFFTVAIYLVGQKKDLFSNTFYLRTMFNNVNGLQTGNNVRLSGINVGSVAAVIIQNDSTIEVTLRVRNNVRQHIKLNTIASIGTDGLMGNMLVNLSPGTGPSPVVNDNDLIPSYSPIRTSDLLKTLTVTNANAAVLTADLLQITQEIRNGKGTVSYLLSNAELRKQIGEIMSNLQLTTRQTALLTAHFNHLSESLEQGKGLAGWLLRDTLSTQQLSKTMTDLQYSVHKIRKASDSLDSYLSGLGKADGPVPALFYDTTMTNDLRKTLENLNVGTAKFSENMEAMRHNVLFKKYFKEKTNEKPGAQTKKP